MVREFKLPDVGEGLTEAEIVNWLVAPGDTVQEDQPVAEVETDKAVVEVPAPVDGTVRDLPAEEGIDVEVVDLRTLSPMDVETIVESFKRTGRAVVVHEAPKTGGLAGEITATIQEEALYHQEAPIARVTGFDVPYPLYALEDYYMPEHARIEDAIRDTHDA